MEPHRLDDDTLVHRIVTGRADAEDWDQLESRAATQPELWEHTVRELRGHAVLQRSMDELMDVVDSIELPESGDSAPVSAAPRGPVVALSSRIASPTRGLWGWAAAVLLLAALLGRELGRPEPDTSPATTPRASIAEVPDSPPVEAEGAPSDPDTKQDEDTNLSSPSVAGTPADAAAETAGTKAPSPGRRTAEFVQDLPSHVVATRAASDGRSIEVLFVRRTLERAVVEEVFGLGQDDAGRVKPVALSPARLSALRKF